MEKYFRGKKVSYNVEEFKKQLNSKNIYLDNYEIDDKFKVFEITCNNDLNIAQIELQFIKYGGLFLNGCCNTEISENDYETVLDIALVVKRNFLIAGFDERSSSDTIPMGISEILNYVSENIVLIQYPVREEDSDFHSFYLYDEYLARPIIFVNTNEYVDNQNFYIAHELYHHFTKDADEEKAERFATEILIPDYVLKVFDREAMIKSLIHIQNLTQAPYKVVIKALYNCGYITKVEYDKLNKINPRDDNSEYAKLAGKDFERLNRKSNVRDVSGVVMKVLVYNLNNGDIDLNSFYEYIEVLYGKEFNPF